MAKTETNIREALSKVDVVGVLAEKELNLDKDANGNDIIKGKMTIQTDSTNFVEFPIYINSKTKDGKDNAAYKGMLTIKDEYKSIAEVGKEDATVVYVGGKAAKVQPNSYIDRSGNVAENVRFNSNFFNRAKDTEPEGFHATFELEMFVHSMRPEVYTSGDNVGEETGNVIVKGYMPLYGGKVEPIELVAPAEDGIADAVQDAIEAGETRLFMGDIVNRRIVTTREIPMTIGKPKIETHTTYKNELVITGVSEAYEEETAYDADVIKAGLALRDERLEAMKAGKAKQGNAGAGAGAASGVNSKPAASGRSLNW